MLSNPAVQTALIGAIVAVLLVIQAWAQEWKRKIETKRAREEQADANATKVVAKLQHHARTSPLPGLELVGPPSPSIEERVTPRESPQAKEPR